MSKILLLVHRLPFPPNKGDKVRSYHLLKHLAETHEVFLGTFTDDPEDEQYVGVIRELCADIYVGRLSPFTGKLRSLIGLISNEPLTTCYYRDPGLKAWVNKTCAVRGIDSAVVFSSAMAQYVNSKPELTTLVDFVDVDSAKWVQYAETHRGPKAWVYRREGKLLLAYERAVAQQSARSFFVTEAEARLFCKLAPECSMHIEPICNGVDADFFSPGVSVSQPFPVNEIPLVFTGAMDYFPNIDAVKWFVDAVMPHFSSRRPEVHFYIVGRSPTAEVKRLASAKITVTGSVPDVRPYLQHAKIVVAPLRIARGVQNKILEAMAMAKPVIASKDCAIGINATAGEHLMVADGVEEYINAIDLLLEGPLLASGLGQAARKRVVEKYSWKANMSVIDQYLGSVQSVRE